MTEVPPILRSMLSEAFPGQPRLVSTFEDLFLSLTEARDAALSAARGEIADVPVLLPEANTEFPNAVVLTTDTATGIEATTVDSIMTLALNDLIPKVDGGFSCTFIVTADTSLILPTAGQLATLADLGTVITALGEPLTKTDDTNVTLTLGGTPATALLEAVSLTLGWAGQLSVPRGGTGAATLTGLVQGNGTSAFTVVTNSSTVGQVLRVTGAATYGWGALDLSDTDAITGDLPFSNLTQGAGLSVLGVTGNVTADFAAITAGTDNQVLRRSGTALTFGAVNLASTNAVTGTLPAGNGGTGVTSLGNITRVDDTNVTLTLTGTPTGAVITSTGFTLGWTGQLSVARGGTGAATLTGLLQGNGTSAVTGITNSSTVGQCLRVTGASTYAWGALDLADTDAVTNDLPFANIVQIATDRLLGRDTAGTGDIEELTCNGGLEFTGTGIRTAAFTGDVTKAAGGTALTIANDAVTYAKMQNISAQYRLLGRSTAGAGDTEEITSSANVFTLLGAADFAAFRTSLGLVIGTNVQAWDATLDSFAAYNTNGLITQTAANTFVGRTLTGTAAEITVTNGDGVAGAPTISIPAAVTFTGKTITGGTYASPTISGTMAGNHSVSGEVTFNNSTGRSIIINTNRTVTAWTVGGGMMIEVGSQTITDDFTAAAGTVASRYNSRLGTPTFASTNAITVTNAATFQIGAAPVAGTNTTITNSYAFLVSAGKSRFVGAVEGAAAILSTSASAGVGYDTGAGGAQTQATNKSTGVTLNNICGQITMNGAALAAATSVSFTFTNSRIAATDSVIVNIATTASANSYTITVDAVAAGSCRIQLRNISAGSLSEALVLNFAVIKGVAS